MDQYYIESGYYDVGYYTYVADAASTIDSASSLSCDATKIAAAIEAAASLSSAFTQTATATRIQTLDCLVSAAFAQTASAGKIIEAAADFGALFSPSITANAVKNQTAILDVVFTTTTVGVANRSTAITTSTIAALNAQAAKTVDTASTMASTATQSATAQVNKTSTVSLSSAFTVTAAAENVQLASASMTVTAVVDASKYTGSGRPRTLAPTSGVTPTYSTTAKFGGYSYSGNTVQSESGDTIPRYADDFISEHWLYGAGAGTTRIYKYWTVGSAGSTAFLEFSILSTGQLRLKGYVNPDGGAQTWWSYTSGVLSAGNWHHILVVKESSTISLFIDGTRQWTDAAGGIGVEYFGFGKNGVRLRLNTYNGEILLDDVSAHYGTTLGYQPLATSITVPTTARINNPTYTNFLYHFNNDLTDDITIVQEMAATMSANFNTAVSGIRTPDGNANLSSIASITASAMKAVSESSTMDSAFTVTASAGKPQSADSTLSAAFTNSIAATKITDVTATASAETAVAASANRTREFAVAVDALFTPVITAEGIKNHTAILDSVATLNASVTVSAYGAAELSAVFTQTTDDVRIRFADSQLTASTELTATETRIQDATATLSSTAAMTITAGEVQHFDIAISAAFTASATATRTRPFATTQLSTASVQVSIINVYRNLGDHVFTAVASVNTTARKAFGADASLSSTSSVTATAAKTTDTVMSAAAAFTDATTAVKTVAVSSNFSAIATQLTAIGYDATGTVLLEPRFTLTANAGKIIEYVGNEISGIKTTATPNHYAVLTSPVTTVIYKSIGLTMVVSARRSDLNDSQAAFWGTTYTSGSLTRFEYVNQTTARLAASLAGTVVYWEWPNAVPYDNDWHQYIVRVKALGVAPYGYDELELWVDGVYKGTTTQWGSLGAWAVFNNVQLGRAGRAGSESENLDFTGDLAQLWIGDTQSDDATPASNVFDLNNFWNGGWIDLGATGTLGGLLPTPAFYTSMDTPYTNLTFIEDGHSVAAIPADMGLPVPDMQARASLSVAFVGVFLNAANLSTAFAQSATAYKIVNAQTTLTSTAALTATAQQIHAGTNVFLTSTTALTANIGKIPSTPAALSAAFSMETQAGYVNVGVVHMSAAVTITTDATKIDPVRAFGELTTAFGLTATAYKIHSGISLEVAAATLTADATVIPPIRGTAEFTSTTTLTAAVSVRREGISLEVSAGTMTVSAVKTANAQTALTADFTIVTNAVKKTGIPATTLQVNGFTLTAGDIINFDPFLTYTIAEERRTLMILPESREYLIEQETREYIIL